MHTLFRVTHRNSYTGTKVTYYTLEPSDHSFSDNSEVEPVIPLPNWRLTQYLVDCLPIKTREEYYLVLIQGKKYILSYSLLELINPPVVELITISYDFQELVDQLSERR